MAADKPDDHVSQQQFEEADVSLEKDAAQNSDRKHGEAAADLIAGQRVVVTEEDVSSFSRNQDKTRIRLTYHF
jgi:hypothetical protein